MRGRRNQGNSRCAFSKPRDQFRDLMSRKLAAFARLCSLSHLDFNLFGSCQICGRYSKSALGDLFDGAVWPITIFATMKTLRILAAFARIGFAANTIHGNGETFMRFRAQRPKRHSGGRKTFPNIFNRFHVLDWNRRFPSRGAFQEISQRVWSNCTHRVHVALVVLRLVGLYEGMESLDHRRRDRVLFTLSPETVITRIAQLNRSILFRCGIREGELMSRNRFSSDFGKT